MAKYIMRLDDACERMDTSKWIRIEQMLDKYAIKPLVGVIPHCEDTKMLQYSINPNFWDLARKWENKGWVIAMHGYNHVYSTSNPGINPINNRSEFAGESLANQKNKIQSGLCIMQSNGINPKVFFAPSHTFDLNTITALKECSRIRIISDTIANKPYSQYGMTFVPQQSGIARRLPFTMSTFCYHPNTMEDKDFEKLENFIRQNKPYFIEFPIGEISRKKNVFDRILEKIYFERKKR